MITLNDASHFRSFATLDGRPMTEGASILALNISYIALVFKLAEKRIYIPINYGTL